MTDALRIEAFAGTDVGLIRGGNEDNMFSGTTVFAVADGMGGHKAGEIASETALRPIASLDGRDFAESAEATQSLRRAIEQANRTVVREATANPAYAGMGTTLTAAIVRRGRLHVAHVGDSRAYLLRDGERMTQLTTDHTLVEQLVQEGRLSREEIATHPQRSVITRAIGVDTEVEVDTLPPLALQAGDQILLCSDGLTGPVGDDEIADVLRATPDGSRAVTDLLALANDHGGPDNITVVLLRVSDADEQDEQLPEPMAAASDPPREQESTITLGRVGTRPPERPSIPIRTRPEPAGSNWAKEFGRYGQRSAADGTGDRPGRGRRAFASLLGAVVLLGVLGVGGWFLLSRAFFIGELDGRVAIFNGLPQEVAGIELYRLRETTDVTMDDLPPLRRQRVEATITAADLAEARAIVADYRDQVEAEDATATPAPTPEADPTSAASG